MITATSIFDLFGNFSNALPSNFITADTGIEATFEPLDVTAWLEQLNKGVSLSKIRTGLKDGKVSIEAVAEFENLKAGYSMPNGWPFVFQSMPDVLFKLQDGEKIQIFATISNCGAEIIIESLPVLIHLPSGLIQPPEKEGDGGPGYSDISRSGTDMSITYRRDYSTTIKTKIRLHITDNNEVSIQTHAPISFEKCIFSGIPCKAIHDFTLIPSPAIARKRIHWLRHSIEPFLETPIVAGMFGIRSIHIDSTEGLFGDIANWLNQNSESEPHAEFVIDDLVVPFYSIYTIPIPRHITMGIRQLLLTPDQIKDPKEVFSFEKAPVQAFFSRDPLVALIVKSFFYKSVPAEIIEQDLGLTFEAGIVFADKSGPEEGEPAIGKNTILFGLDDNYTIFAGYQRFFNETTGNPEEGTDGAEVLNGIFTINIAGFRVSLIGFRLGYSIGRHLELEKNGESDKFIKSAEITVDFLIGRGGNSEEDDTEDGLLSIQSTSGEEIKYIIVEGLGMRQGTFHLADKISIPDGMILMFGKTVGIIIEELGWITEQGANYFSFSGGVVIKLPAGSEGGVVFKKMRFKISGNAGAPAFKLDGFFVFIKMASVQIEAGGYYSEKEIGTALVKEFGLTGKVVFELSAIEYTIGLDLIAGKLVDSEEEFEYLMMQLFFHGSITMAWFELRGIRLLFAHNMQPKLGTFKEDSPDMRYFKWYKDSNPVNVPGDRRLAAWQPKNDAWSLGIGLSCSIASLGSVAELGVFVLVISAPEEGGFLIVGELFLLGNTKKPAGYFALEWDNKNDRFNLMIGVDLKISNFLDNPPKWTDNIAKLSGTLFISNDPGTVAIGRLADERTWLTLQFDFDLWIAKAFIKFALCFEYVDGGPFGFGIIIRLEGEIDVRIIKISFHLGIGILVATFSTGSCDYAVAIWIEGSLRITLFGFIHLGISAGIEYRNVGRDPSRGELKARFKFETPWFLPDVTWTVEHVHGKLEPDLLVTAVSPLRIANGSNILKETLEVHIERFDNSWNGNDQAPLYKVKQLREHSVSVSDRVNRFESNTSLKPLPIDATIEVEFSTAVNDKLMLDTNILPGLGNQSSEDLTLAYDFIRFSIRRRKRFGNSRPWTEVDTREELAADFSDPDGVQLSGAFGPSTISKSWDPEILIKGGPAAKKLRVNAKTPYEYTTENPELDQTLIDRNQNYPCCNRKDLDQIIKDHTLDFRDELIGADIIRPKYYSNSNSEWQFLTQALIRFPILGSLPESNQTIGMTFTRRAGILAVTEFDTEISYCILHLAWQVFKGFLRVVAFNRVGDKTKVIDIDWNSKGFETILIGANFPIRRIELQFIATEKPKEIEGEEFRDIINTSFMSASQNFSSLLIEVDSAKYISLSEYLSALLVAGNCLNEHDEDFDPYLGTGKLSFLPNHDYEIAITTRITIDHPSKSADPAELTEYVYFKTKGLPGLNAIERIGEEVEPYVVSVYDGGKGILYREEPVALAFTEDFHVAVPLAVRPAGGIEEHLTLMRMQLLVKPDVALTNETLVTTTSEDWIVGNREIFIPGFGYHWYYVFSKSITTINNMISVDPRISRLAQITQRPELTCEFPDPRNVKSSVLLGPPQGVEDPRHEGLELWPANSIFTSNVRMEQAPFVDRASFIAEDLTAFKFATDVAITSSTLWRVEQGAIILRAEPSGDSDRKFAIFGDNDWNHLQINMTISIEEGLAGLGVGIPATNIPTHGLFTGVRRDGANYHLEIYRTIPGNQFENLASQLIPSEEINVANGTIQLQIFAYDDIFRASVGSVAIETQRGNLRDGKFSLFGQNHVRFHNLLIQGLDMFTFPFRTSRFISFEDHIQSFNGHIDILEEGLMGDEGTSITISDLLTTTWGAITEAMQTDSDPLERQEIFDQWIDTLGIPLKDELLRLEISQFTEGGQTAFLLFESPEPLDFTEEIELQFFKRIQINLPETGLPWPERPELDPRIINRPIVPEPLLSKKTDKSLSINKLREDFKRKVFSHSEINLGLKNNAIDVDSAKLSKDIGRKSKILDIDIIDDNNLIFELQANKTDKFHIRSEQFLIVEKLGDNNNLKTFRGIISKYLPNGKIRVTAEKDQITNIPDRAINKKFIKKLKAAPIGSYLIYDDINKRFFDAFIPKFIWFPINLLVIQNSTSTRAIAIPISGSNHVPLTLGKYRLNWSINRQRWSTTDTPNDLNHYKKSKVIYIDL